MKNDLGIFIEWNQFDRRSDILCKYLKYQMYFVHAEIKNRLLIKFKHILYFFITFNIFRKIKPKIVICTNNIFIHGLSAFIFSRIFNSKLVYDTHSDPFTSRLRAFTYPEFIHKYLVKKASLNLVHTPGNANIIKRWGGKVMIFPDIVDEELEKSIRSSESLFEAEKSYATFICTYSDDEPYEEAIDAFSNYEHLNFYITGKIKKDIIISKHNNVIHTDYLANDDYLNIINGSLFIITLTNRENTMQCAGNEGLSLGKPMLLSDTVFLRDYFNKGCIFAKNTAKEIAAGIDIILSNIDILQNEILELRNEKVKYRKKLINKYFYLVENDNN